MRRLLLATTLALAGCPGTSGPPATGIAAPTTRTQTSATGLRYEEIVEGSGPSPRVGQKVVVHYLGRHVDGTVFDGSRQRGEPFSFKLGEGRVIKGWEEGILTMKVGGVRRLIVPPELAYGAEGSKPSIAPNETLVFDVELLGIE